MGGSAGCTGCHFVEKWPAPNAPPSAQTTPQPSVTTPPPASDANPNPNPSEAPDQTTTENPFGFTASANDPLTIDDTSACHTVGNITCPGNPTPAQFESMIGDGKCVVTESTKIDDMCDDGPCDNDPLSKVCQLAKGK